MSDGHALRKRHLARWPEELIRAGLFLFAMASVLTTAGILWVLARETWLFFSEVSVWEFLTGTEWTPLFDPAHYGILPLLCGTALITAIAGLVAVPLGLGSAIYLSEYARPGTKRVLKPALEVLAGIPSVVYGYLALTAVTPLLRAVLPDTNVFNAASAGIVVGTMILPVVASLCDDSLRAVPESLRQAGYAMGATKFEVTMRIVVPAALSGVMASTVLALSRAVGETMAVTLAAGATPRLTANPLESVQTLTAYIVQVSLGDTPAGTRAYHTLFAVAMVLFAMTLAMNVLANRILKRFRDVYE